MRDPNKRHKSILAGMLIVAGRKRVDICWSQWKLSIKKNRSLIGSVQNFMVCNHVGGDSWWTEKGNLSKVTSNVKGLLWRNAQITRQLAKKRRDCCWGKKKMGTKDPNHGIFLVILLTFFGGFFTWIKTIYKKTTHFFFDGNDFWIFMPKISFLLVLPKD